MVEPPPPPSPPPPDPAAPPPASEPGLCPRCGAPYDPYQEYCLECGVRLPPPYGVRRDLWSGGSPLWLWAALAALLLVALVAGAIAAVAVARNDEEAAQPKSSIPVVTTGPGTTDTVGIITQPPTVTITPPSTTYHTTSTLATTTAGTTTIGTTTTGNVSWPAGKDGYTVVLKSVPTSEGREQADQAAARARSNGLPQVGVLNSSDYSSLNAGYYVTFSGIYDTSQQANSALPYARSHGFPTAYPRRVSD